MLVHIDFEVFSNIDIKDSPFDVYASDPSTKIILAAYAFDDGPVKVWQETDGPLRELRMALLDLRNTIVAWNTTYERRILAAKGLNIPLERWLDPMILARYAGLPGRLKDCAKIPMIGVPKEEATKNETLLITKFCKPAKDGTVKDAKDYPEDWNLFVEYCRKDVLTMRHVLNWLLPRFEFPERERELWMLDQKINDRGIPVDVNIARTGMRESARLIAAALAEIGKITDLENPNSVPQIHPWLQERGYKFNSLGKEFLKQAQEGTDLNEEARAVVGLRLGAAKSSVKKFKAFVENTSPDGRLRGQFVYGGAHTMRWSGRGVQPQNLTRKSTDQETLNALLTNRPVQSLEPLTTCLRPCIRASKGKKLVVADLAAIENRVLAWLSGSLDMLQIYENGLDPYKAFGVELFNVPYDSITKEQRQLCKPAVLGCGYGLGGGQERQLADGQVVKTGLWAYAEGMGVNLERGEAHRMVQVFRNTYPDVLFYWNYLEEAFLASFKTRKRQQVGALFFTATPEAIKIELPSGRFIHYLNPHAWAGRGEGIKLSFDGYRMGGWGRQSTYGGRLTENVVQAVSRDVLAEGMLRAEAAGLPIVLHCHDEIVVELDVDDTRGPKDLSALMAAPIDWAPGLPLAAEGWEGTFYGKG